jgi:hypothetical protein
MTEAKKEDVNKRLGREGNRTKGNKTKTNYLYKYNSALSPSES